MGVVGLPVAYEEGEEGEGCQEEGPFLEPSGEGVGAGPEVGCGDGEEVVVLAEVIEDGQQVRVQLDFAGKAEQAGGKVKIEGEG